MIKKENRRNAHHEIDHIFKDLFPAQGMGSRPAQIALSHRMLDAMLEVGIALCDAGTGIGKTYAYLVAGTVFHRNQASSGQANKPLLISTSSIALQNAVLNEYLPFLSHLLMADGLLDKPLRAVIRKGKRLSPLQRRNWSADRWAGDGVRGPLALRLQKELPAVPAAVSAPP